MPQWGPFLFLAGLVTVLLLVLAGQSQRLIHDQATRGPGSTESEDEETPLGPVRDGAAPADSPAKRPSDPREDSQEPVAGDDTGIELTTSALLLNVATTQAVVAAILVVAAWYLGVPADAFGISADALSTGFLGVAVGVAFGTVLWVANELSTSVADVVGTTYDETVREMLAPDTTGGWVVLFVVVLPIIAFAEELLFRAALIGVPAAGFNISPWLLAVVSSLAFALGHGAQGRVGIVVTGGLGFALAAGYIVTQSLLVVVVAHYVVNALEFFIHEFLGEESLPLALVADVSDRN